MTDGDKDSIGDACDSSPSSPDGDLVSLCLKMPLEAGSPPGPVVATVDPNPGRGCVTGTITTPPPTPTPPPKWGDVDCSGTINSIDALKILRYSAGLTYTRPPGCPDLGAAYP
jgi:hypothetical protein